METPVSPSSIRRFAFRIPLIGVAAALLFFPISTIPAQAAGVCGTKTIVTCKDGSYYCKNTPGMSCANPAFTPTSKSNAAFTGSHKAVPFSSSKSVAVAPVVKYKYKKAWSCKKWSKKKCVYWTYRLVKVKAS